MSVLEVRDLSIRFGGLQALKDVSLTVNEFEIVGLIGPNGAGKTTAFNCITGFYKPDTGTVTYRGVDVTREPPHKKAAMGFGRTFQNVGMVKSATALDNLKSAMHARAGYGALAGMVGAGSSWRAEKQLAERADAILDMLGLQSVRDQRVGGQSYGTLKLLELGCALATDPDILLLDEPTSGMGPDESDELGERLLALRKEFGLTMLVIEHHVPLVLRVCDHVYVLNFGQLLAEGPPSVIQTHPEVVAAYLGGSAPDALEQTVETEEDAELDAQLEHAVHELPAVDADTEDEDPVEVQADPQVDEGLAVLDPFVIGHEDLAPAGPLDPPTDELPVVAGAHHVDGAPDEQPLRPRRRRVPRVPLGGSERLGESESVSDEAALEAAADTALDADPTATVLSPARPARPRRIRRDQP